MVNIKVYHDPLAKESASLGVQRMALFLSLTFNEYILLSIFLKMIDTTRNACFLVI